MSKSNRAKERRKRLLAYSLPPLAAAVGVSAGRVLRNRLERRHTFAPGRFPYGSWSPRGWGLPAEDVWFFAADGEELHGWWLPDPEARGTVLYCHGNKGSLGSQIQAVRELRRLRANVLAFDYRGYGRSSGQPSREGVLRDVRAAYDYLVGPLGRKPEEILLFGHSLGGAIAIDCALDREAAGLVVQSSFMDTKEMARQLYPQLPMHWIAPRRFRSVDKVQSLAIPKLFIHGDADETIPLEHGRGLYAAAADPKELYVVHRAGHNNVHSHGGHRYVETVSGFRDRCLSRYDP